jgi:F0F1-type ATP synthase membrane subunit b/b'
MYRAQEKALKDLQDRHASALAAAHAGAEAQLKQAKAQLAAEVTEVKGTLSAESSALADRIAETILRRSAA